MRNPKCHRKSLTQINNENNRPLLRALSCIGDHTLPATSSLTLCSVMLTISSASRNCSRIYFGARSVSAYNIYRSIHSFAADPADPKQYDVLIHRNRTNKANIGRLLYYLDT